MDDDELKNVSADDARYAKMRCIGRCKLVIMRLLLVLLVWAAVDALNLPGIAPISFKKGENVQLKVNSLDSVTTQLPIEYYEVPFCKTDDAPQQDSEVML